jgi:hypothetical protein
MNGRNGEPIEVTYNGYLGIAYGVSSYSIRNPEGKEILHTGFTTFPVDTEEKALEYLKESLETLKMLQPKQDVTRECDYVKGLHDAWNIAKLLRHPSYPGALYDKEKEKIFGFRESDQILTHVDPVEALERFNKFKAEKASINPGDEVIYTDPTEGHTKRYVITCVENDRYGWIDEEGHTGCFNGRMFHKTGRFFPEIEKIKEAMSCAK